MNTQYGTDNHNTSCSPAIHILNLYPITFPHLRRKTLCQISLKNYIVETLSRRH